MSTKKISSSVTTEVRIGIADSSQEIQIACDLAPEKVAEAVNTALESGKPLALTDTRGRQTIIANNKISFVEIGESAERKVGFASA